MRVTIRQLEARDIDTVLEIQAQCREASPWLRNDYQALVRDAAPCFVAEAEGGLAAFLAARKLADEMEILNLAVARAARRQGIASQLLTAAMKWSEQNGINKIHLEVRASNAAARGFYESRSFRATGTRPNYYRNPTDDALLMAASVRTP
ncbi:MAG TPA: ribosomal protein S18-alanine N-acetyltransferase [Candidatus Acidoferrales bacterium]|nr:ribosomal protein S18-alanine N-acetyltransferase [Candidatus Acidoferrales bacterium]